MAKPNPAQLQALAQASADVLEQSLILQEDIKDEATIDRAALLAQVQEIRRFLSRIEALLLD